MFYCLSLHVEVFFSIKVGDFLDHLTQEIVILRHFSFFYPLTQKIAEDSSEILMSWIGNKGSGISQHSHKLSKQREVRKRDHLLFHTILLVIEPPSGTELNLHDPVGFTLEVSDHGGHDIIVSGIEVIKDGLRQLVFHIQCIHES